MKIKNYKMNASGLNCYFLEVMLLHYRLQLINQAGANYFLLTHWLSCGNTSGAQMSAASIKV